MLILRKFLTWYLLSIKQIIKKKTFWLQMAFFILILWTASSISVPTSSNCHVAFYDGGSETGKTLFNKLSKEDSAYDFVSKASAKDVEEMVISGQAECGFIVNHDIDQRIEDDNLKDIFTYVSSSFTTKGLTAKETVFATFFQMYGSEILDRTQSDIFGTDNEEIGINIQNSYSQYLEGDEVFNVIFKDANGDVIPASQHGSTSSKMRNMGILILILLVISFIFMRREDRWSSDKNMWNYLPGKQRRIFLFARYAASWSVLAVFGFIFAFLFKIL